MLYHSLGLRLVGCSAGGLVGRPESLGGGEVEVDSRELVRLRRCRVRGSGELSRASQEATIESRRDWDRSPETVNAVGDR